MTRQKLLANYDRLLAKHGSQRLVAKAVGIPRTTLQDWLRSRNVLTAQAPKPTIVVRAPKRRSRRFILTSAQDNTPVHEGFLTNLEAYAEAIGAEILIGGFTYNKRLFEENRPDRDRFDDRVEPYLTHRQFALGDNLLFCAEMNTLPTATQPLSGFEVYTGSKWGIFPHAKIQLRSIPTMKGEPAKQIMTTGAVTVSNYVQKRAGIRAHFHHALGAVLVEIDRHGDHFCRHLIGEHDTGAFYDLDSYVSDGQITTGHRVEAIGWGDVHHDQLDPVVAEAAWGKGGMLDRLRPQFQFIHDALDFHRRNHHNMKDPHYHIRMLCNETESVEEEVRNVAGFLENVQREWVDTVVVASNHDAALLRWLKEADWRIDPVNAEFWLEAQLACVRAIQNKDSDFSVFEWAARKFCGLEETIFLREDESFTICAGTIECGMHGHLGANGAKGTPRQFTRMGKRANTGHTHSPEITDGIYTGGTSSNLDMIYNSGLSSWSHAHVVTYANGKRCIVTMQGGKWRAE